MISCNSKCKAPEFSAREIINIYVNSNCCRWVEKHMGAEWEVCRDLCICICTCVHMYLKGLTRLPMRSQCFGNITSLKTVQLSLPHHPSKLASSGCQVISHVMQYLGYAEYCDKMVITSLNLDIFGSSFSCCVGVLLQRFWGKSFFFFPLWG